jgi:hypothetical protein
LTSSTGRGVEFEAAFIGAVATAIGCAVESAVDAPGDSVFDLATEGTDSASGNTPDDGA